MNGRKLMERKRNEIKEEEKMTKNMRKRHRNELRKRDIYIFGQQIFYLQNMF